MEGRVLSDPRIVELSRHFVCVRPNTYENEAEAEFMKTLFRARNDNLENTTFCLLAPDGQTRVSRGGRSPSMVFGGIEGFLVELEALIQRYPAQAKPRSSQPVYPAQESVALGLNVAASDGLPLVLLAGGTQEQRTQVVGALAAQAFSAPLVGRLHYGVLADEQGLALLERGGDLLGLPEQPELWLVRPETFARSGEVVERFPLPADNPALWAGLAGTVAAAWESALPQKAETAREHLRAGEREGIEWESELPVTDGHSSGAADRRERRRR